MLAISSAVNAVLLVTLGIVLANILVETGIFSRLLPFAGPFCRASGLSDACAFSIFRAALPLALRPVRRQGCAGYVSDEDGREGGHGCAGDGCVLRGGDRTVLQLVQMRKRNVLNIILKQQIIYLATNYLFVDHI